MSTDQLTRRALTAIAVALKAALKQRMAAVRLNGSKLERTLDVKVTNNKLELFLGDYWRYLEDGRRPLSRKVPIDALLKWIKRAGLTLTPGQSNISLAYAVQRAIYKRGLKPRPFFALAVGDVEAVIDTSVTELLGSAFDEAAKLR